MKGISAVVAGTIMILLIVIGVIPLIMLYINTAQEVYSTYRLSVSLSESKELEEIKANLSNDILTIVNEGAIPVDLTYIVLKDKSGKCNIVMHVYDIAFNDSFGAVISTSGVTSGGNDQGVVRLNVNGYLKINISKLGLGNITDVCNIATSKGNVIEVKKIVAVLAEKATAIIITPVTLEAATLANRTDVTVSEAQIEPAIPESNSSNAGLGMARTSSDGTSVTALVRYAYIESSNPVKPKVRIVGGDDPDSENPEIPFNNIFIGYNPDWSKTKEGPPRYNIMITSCVPTKFIIYKSNIKQPIFNSSDKFHTDQGSYYLFNIDVCFRMKIVNYEPESGTLKLKYDVDGDGILDTLTNEEALGYWWLYSGTKVDVSLWVSRGVIQGYLELNGTASEIIIYVNADDIGYPEITEGSYEPYIFSADVDGNTYPEFVFITEDQDCSAGNLTAFLCSYNDVDKTSLECGTFTDDWSTRMFLINLTGYQINGNDIAFVRVALRVYFHDNYYDNREVIPGILPLTNEVKNDRPIFGVYLVNALTGNIVSSREWLYSELDGYENTYPPNKNFVVLSAMLPVPEGGTYYIAIGFQDPYSNEKVDDLTPWPSDGVGNDDGDFIIALEVASITYYARP